MKGRTQLKIWGIALLILVIATGFFAKLSHDNKLKQEQELKLETTTAEVNAQTKAFSSEDDRTKKLEILKTLENDYASYKKGATYADCTKIYKKALSDMKSYFQSDYDNTLEQLINEIGTDVSDYSDKDKLNEMIQSFSDFKETLKTEYEKFHPVSEDKYNEYNSLIDQTTGSYTARVTALEEEEKEAARQNSASQSGYTGSSSSSSYSNTYNSGYSTGSTSDYNSGYGYNYNYNSNYNNGYSSDGSYSGGANGNSGNSYNSSNDYNSGNTYNNGSDYSGGSSDSTESGTSESGTSSGTEGN